MNIHYTNIMFQRLLLSFIFLFLFASQVFALDVVYPSSKNVTINAESTFVYGNVKPNETLKINSQGVKIWDEGVFVHVVPLYFGDNEITFESTLDGKKEVQKYVITRNKPVTVESTPVEYLPKREGYYLYTRTNRNNCPVRSSASSSSKRVFDLPEGIVLYLAGQQGNYYKIEEQGKTDFWIHKDNIETPVLVSKRINAIIKTPERYSDKYYDYVHIPVNYPVMYSLEQDNKKIKLVLYGVNNYKDTDDGLYNNLEFVFENDDPVVGYEAYYQTNRFVFKRAKVADKINSYRPLHNVRIFIDAGHGGSEKGAIGPTRVNEKDINLSIAKKLINELQKEGAIVSYSRVDDSQVQLYDRVQMAKDNNAFILLSIHNNSLPNGKNPFIQHGAETYYYNDNAKVLGYIIQNNLVKDLGLNDSGLRKNRFALNSSTNPISVLVEVAYMINPTEYKQLQSPTFQDDVAKSLTKSLKEFMVVLKK